MDLRRGVLFGVLAFAACDDGPPGRTFYERNIEPILTQQCAGNTSGCHSINAGDPYAFAAGNLDVTSFENVQKRRDTLTPVEMTTVGTLNPNWDRVLYYHTDAIGSVRMVTDEAGQVVGRYDYWPFGAPAPAVRKRPRRVSRGRNGVKAMNRRSMGSRRVQAMSDVI